MRKHYTLNEHKYLYINKEENAAFLKCKLKIVSDLFTLAHDRFIIIDDEDVYHFGASLKDLGKKWFAFSKIERSDMELLSKLEKLK